ncbi:MAG: hypothetical protein Q9M22_01045 [Mariprofundaceae bacterium]|nr:hypothetical protein [Mariprofundaceae bacterium]
MSAEIAHAVAPANALITNTATMTYTGLASPILASVDVRVSLVTAAPTVTVVAANVTIAENQTGTLEYTITANANGPDNYTINAPTNIASNVTINGTPVASVAFIPLGATALAVAMVAGSNTLTVPSDRVADGQVNGITSGDTIVMLGQTYTVATVIDNAAGNSTITLTTHVPTALVLGTLVAEQAVFTVAQNMGLVAAGATQGINDVTVTASSSNNQISAAATGRMTVLHIAFQKWVSVNGGAFTQATPNVGTGNTITYRLLTIIPMATTINGVVFQDAIPIFTTYVANSTRIDTDGPHVTTAVLTPVADINGTTPLVQAGGLAVNSTGQAAGTIAATAALAAEVSVEFQVTID